jgi:dTDP-4-dehydrorhamnose 3,5-epimerase
MPPETVTQHAATHQDDRQAGRRLASAGDLQLAVPECAKGVGSVIMAADSPDLIAGVRVQPLSIFPDDRGYFLEVQRFGRGLAADFPATRSQISAALNFAGTVKAFHFHLHQTDCWTPVKGMLQVALVDLRLGSLTFGRRNTIYAGPLRPWQVLIPPGVAHGYKVIGNEEALLVYMTDQFYNPQDEGRIPYNDSSINYDWETQHK